MTLTEAQKKLEEIETQRPAAYTSSYRDEMSALGDQLRNRKFNWNQNADALYKQYADRYIQQGKLAMKDSMGQTAALTGGYGNSYGSAVGQQTYDAYLQALADAGLGIYDRAYTRYKDAGDALADEYGRLKDLDDADYDRWSDELKAWMDDRDYYAGLEDTLYQRALAEAAAAAARSYGGGSGKRTTDTGTDKNRYNAVLAQVRLLDAGGSSSNTIQGKINTAYNAGSITEAQKNWLTNNFGSGNKSGNSSSSNVKKPGLGLRLA